MASGWSVLLCTISNVIMRWLLLWWQYRSVEGRALQMLWLGTGFEVMASIQHQQAQQQHQCDRYYHYPHYNSFRAIYHQIKHTSVVVVSCANALVSMDVIWPLVPCTIPTDALILDAFATLGVTRGPMACTYEIFAGQSTGARSQRIQSNRVNWQREVHISFRPIDQCVPMNCLYIYYNIYNINMCNGRVYVLITDPMPYATASHAPQPQQGEVDVVGQPHHPFDCIIMTDKHVYIQVYRIQATSCAYKLMDEGRYWHILHHVIYNGTSTCVNFIFDVMAAIDIQYKYISEKFNWRHVTWYGYTPVHAKWWMKKGTLNMRPLVDDVRFRRARKIGQWRSNLYNWGDYL